MTSGRKSLGKKTKCLVCQKSFKAIHKFNRVCIPCKNNSSWKNDNKYGGIVSRSTGLKMRNKPNG